MKLALIYNPNDNKLREDSYSQTYRQMFLALIDRFEEVQHITKSCSAKDIEADVIIFYDVHSSHHIRIDGIDKHKAVKYEYLDDPFQVEMKGQYKNGQMVYKLGAEQRIKRLLSRGVENIICPYTDTYYKCLAPYLCERADEMLVWFPVAPDARLFKNNHVPLVNRICHGVLANGALGDGGSGIYDFRKWIYKQQYVIHIPHVMYNSKTPTGEDYYKLLTSFDGGLAVTDFQVVPKYLEIPLAGCVCFCRWHEDYGRMGFKDGESCVVLDSSNRLQVKDRICDFLKSPSDYQSIADKGRKIIEDNWTSVRFADFIYEHARKGKQ